MIKIIDIIYKDCFCFTGFTDNFAPDGACDFKYVGNVTIVETARRSTDFINTVNCDIGCGFSRSINNPDDLRTDVNGQ